MKVAFISCVKSKRKGRHRAKDMYISSLFRFAWQHTNRRFDKVFILSAKHGLLLPDNKIRNYDLTLNTMSRDERKQWSKKVVKQIRQQTTSDNDTEFYFFCGKRYREFLIELLSDQKCFVPLKGLGFGQQLQWYKNNP